MSDKLIFKTFRLEMKATSPDGTFDGIASTSALDSDQEIVDKGAFTLTLAKSKGIFPILWQHNREAPVGWNKAAEEGDGGLQIHAQLLMNSEQGRYAHDFISTGLNTGGQPGLSIGFQVPKGGDYIKDGIRHFKTVILREVSIVTFPANSEAVVTAAKRKEGGSVSKLLEFKGQDFAQEMARGQALDEHYDLKWKADKALRDVIDNICADKECKNDEKKLLIHKALDGHGGVMKDWWSAFLDITQPEEDDQEEMSEEEMSALLETLSKGGALSLTVKEGRALSARTKMALKRCMANIHESNSYSKMSVDCKKKALAQLDDLATGRYFNDVNAPHPVGGGASTTPPKPATTNPVGGGGKTEEETLRERIDRLEREHLEAQAKAREEIERQKRVKDEELLDEIANSLKTMKA